MESEEDIYAGSSQNLSFNSEHEAGSQSFAWLRFGKVLCNSGKLVLKKTTKKDQFLTSKLPRDEACCSIGFPAGASGSMTGRVRFYLSQYST